MQTKLHLNYKSFAELVQGQVGILAIVRLSEWSVASL